MNKEYDYKNISGFLYANEEAQKFISEVMDSNSAHFFLKDIIMEGLKKDCVDTLNNLRLAIKVFELVFRG